MYLGSSVAWSPKQGDPHTCRPGVIRYGYMCKHALPWPTPLDQWPFPAGAVVQAPQIREIEAFQEREQHRRLCASRRAGPESQSRRRGPRLSHPSQASECPRQPAFCIPLPPLHPLTHANPPASFPGEAGSNNRVSSRPQATSGKRQATQVSSLGADVSTRLLFGLRTSLGMRPLPPPWSHGR